MNISHSTSIPKYALSVEPTIKSKEPEAQFSKEVEKTQDASLKKKDTSNIWKELAEKYDVTNATFDELNEISMTLYEFGEISLKEHAILSFDFDRGTEYLKREVSGLSSNFTMYATQADKLGNRNWIKEFQARADRAFGHGNSIGHHMNLDLAGILKKLER